MKMDNNLRRYRTASLIRLVCRQKVQPNEKTSIGTVSWVVQPNIPNSVGLDSPTYIDDHGTEIAASLVTNHLIQRGYMQIGVESSRAVENKRIFVVDSDEINRAVLQFMLHDENETHELADLSQAYAKAAQWKPDLILLGMGIVQAQGSAILNEIRARIPGAKLVIIADSATDPNAQACLKAGAHSLLAKPFTIEAVRRKVDVQLGRRTALSIPVQVA